MQLSINLKTVTLELEITQKIVEKLKQEFSFLMPSKFVLALDNGRENNFIVNLSAVN